MAALIEQIDQETASKLASLQASLLTAPPPPALPTAAICPACGQPKPAPAAMFRAPVSRGRERSP
jgi:hypothetical protein